MARKNKLRDMLNEQLTDLEVFGRLLRISAARQKLFKCLSALMSSGKPLATQLQNKFIMRYVMMPKVQLSNTSEIISQTYQTFSDDFDDNAIDFGLRLGSFLSEAGWLSESINILSCVASRLERCELTQSTLLLRLDCLQRLLHSEANLCSFKSADRTYQTIMDLVKSSNSSFLNKFTTTSYVLPKSLLANIYAQLSVLFFARSEYTKSYEWSIKALNCLNSTTPEKIVIDVLRQAARSCVVKREFKRANMLICQALRRAKIKFGRHHQKYADALLDYGFFLLNVDSVSQSVDIYEEALSIKRHIFGDNNFHVAIAHEDLSYAYYVYEYSSGNFRLAKENVEKAVKLMKNLVPSNHLMLASAKRVKALLLEEIALDKMAVSDGKDEEGLLIESEELHICALKLSLEAFGEINVQTAKHYGNLGRLYQSMGRFEEAERMHKKAIRIKTDLLGPYDYEVGLSIGHLASLYNYHMLKYHEAEELYLRSIEISLRLFGKAYSGLEYDYIGLCHIYDRLGELDKWAHYSHTLEVWQNLRGEHEILRKPTYPEICDDSSLIELTQKFFEMCSNSPTGDGKSEAAPLQALRDDEEPPPASSSQSQQQQHITNSFFRYQ
ncbi:amyloid protein-binding protein 2 isoform X2 [Condylostylus longicornis]|nr:amyloid protein-binding protein 2 isoform X2 [Condylostylus longicornis]XP_055370838.1 amyloid protein-binding protein 2 isoform X2 [Condylostylus longicornis]